MMKTFIFIKRVCLAFLSLYLFIALTAQAANVDINWHEPEKFRDIRGGVESQESFQDRVIAALSSYFEEAADSSLSADQSLSLTITDVDLAGDVEYFFFRFPRGIRVMRDIYFPSIEFNYELKDDNGVILKSGEENIKDMGFMFSNQLSLNDPPFDYEKRMIDNWFRENFN